MNSKKRKERKQMISIAVAAAILLLLIILYFVITNSVNGNDGDTDTTDTQAPMDIGTFTIADENYAELSALSYSYSGETLNFELSDNKWVIKEDPEFPVDQQKIFYMAQSVSDYGGFRRLSYTDSCLEAYGLDEPLYDISATYTNDSGTHTNRFRIGDKNALTGYYYFYQDGSSYVYMVNNSIFQYFSYMKSDLFVSYEVSGPEVKDMTALTVTAGENVIEIEIPESAAVKDEDGNIEYSPAEKIMSAMYHELRLKYKYCVDYSVTDAEKAEYGLDTPALSVKLDYVRYQSVSTEEGTSGAQISYDDTFSVHFGNKFTEVTKDEDGKESTVEKIYFVTDYSDIVYSADYATYLEILVAAGLE